MSIDPTVQKSLVEDDASHTMDAQIHKSGSTPRTLSPSKLPEWIIDFDIDAVVEAMADLPKTIS